MSVTEKATIHLRLHRRVTHLSDQPVRLGDVASLFAPPELESKLREAIVYRHNPADGHIVMVEMLDVLHAVERIAPKAAVEVYGEPQAIVELRERKGSPNVILVAFVLLLLFLGSGLAIMNFHADVNMLEVQRKIYQFITGREDEHPYLLQIPYSLGLAAGMMIFFNRLFKKRFNEEPTPLELEMYLYEQNINQYIVTEEYRKKRETEGG
ncbi:stage V sporulation protein AA [Xylanibacillus composti]|uniref:Stage V sporulation protein AA n=1 Tax=Xylanibacillus composti TaxID=1572762 RepID=A0A8J4M273_9BACL|nr:stage V sporulation protein AA [Xylanibacillus composti]MDT9726674.1 stage V sporulation protein AA [Xylanibacillus composti]GIQ69394.1 stage V sporulation protein AA [Xylanibacillus composti]